TATQRALTAQQRPKRPIFTELEMEAIPRESPSQLANRLRIKKKNPSSMATTCPANSPRRSF
ncbi:HTH-type transcriptional regulator immR, partial [Dysosmobacter welbionis]